MSLRDFRKKIKSPEALASILASLKQEGKKVALCHGAFDLLHRGHVHQFEQALAKVDLLVVSLTADAFIVKGPDRPVFNQTIRAEMEAVLEVVDFVVITESPTAVEVIKLLRPDYYVKGEAYKDASQDTIGNIGVEEDAIKSVGGEMLFTHEMQIRSTPLINSWIDPFPPEVVAYLGSFKEKFPFSVFAEALESFQALRVLLIGEVIIDQYDYVEPMDTSPKGGVIATRYLGSESFAGGILACANHMATLCSTVDVVSTLGAHHSHEQFVRESLVGNVQPWFLMRDGQETLVKQRQVEKNYYRKITETYRGSDVALNDSEERDVLAHVGSIIDDYDLVFVVDYGHGLMTPKIVDLVSRNRARHKLAVNVQVNSANKGFHLVTRYPLVDFVSLTQFEARLAFSDKLASPGELADRIMADMGASMVAITLGRNGSTVADKTSCSHVPSFSKRIVDTVGAGDAHFSVASLAYVSGLSSEFVGFVGNVAGALATTYIGNKTPITKRMLMNFGKTLLA
jgi:rfaE bifunctional protein nucleotidyltransferase chain/domain